MENQDDNIKHKMNKSYMNKYEIPQEYDHEESNGDIASYALDSSLQDSRINAITIVSQGVSNISMPTFDF